MPCFPKPQAAYEFKLGRGEKNDLMKRNTKKKQGLSIDT